MLLFEALESRAMLSTADLASIDVPAVMVADTASGDVSVAITDVTLPSSITAGETPSGFVSVTVANNGASTTPSAATINFSVRARPVNAADASSDVVLAVFNAVSIGNISPGLSAPFSLGVTLPSQLANGSYRIAVVGTPSNDVGDANSANNTAISAYSLTSSSARDVSVSISNVTLPTSIFAGQTPTGTVSITISNAGQTATPTGSTIDLSVRARLATATSAAGDIILASATDQPIGAMLPGASVSITVNVALSSQLTEGGYKIVVVGTPSTLVADTNSANDTAISAYSLTVLKSSDVAVSVTGVSLPTSIRAGDTPSGTVSVAITNTGQNDVPPGATIDLSLRARPTTAIDGASDVFLGTLPARAIGSLESDAVVTAVFNVTLPAIFEDGTYRMVVVGTPSAAAGDINSANDTGVSVYTLTVTGAKDVAVSVVGVTLPANVRAGQTPSGTVSVMVTNTGQDPTPAGATIDLAIRARLTTATDTTGDIQLSLFAGQPLSNLAPGASIIFLCNVTVPTGFPGGSYHLVVIGTGSGSLADSDDANDTATSVYTLTVTGPDLTVALGAITVPTTYLAGNVGTATVPVTVSNSGTAAVNVGAWVDLVIRFSPTDGGHDIVLQNIHEVRVGGFTAGQSKSYKFKVTLPRTIPANTYRIVAEIDPLNRLAETNEDNNLAVSSTQITLTQRYVDLTAAVFRPTLPTPVLANSPFKTSVSISIINSSNQRLALGTKIDLQIGLFRMVDGVPVGTDLFAQPLVLLAQSIGGLDPGRSKVLTKKITLPALPAGDYVYLGVVDNADSLAEVNEGNNFALSVPFRVG